MPQFKAPSDKLPTQAINTIRTLSMDAVQAANSGHPGTAMSMAPLVSTLFNNHMNYDPANPAWPNRDRFVLSAGHASMLLYSILHLTGVQQIDDNRQPTGQPAVSLDEIKQFRQLDSKCPGHPEYRWTSGVETTSGPLGQGLANSVGMAIAGQWQAERFNKPGYDLFDYNVYALCGDGCMMEGLSNEAASLAGHLKLSNLCWIYDSNHITIEGDTELAFTEDVAGRFKALGWNVLKVDDANDLDAIDKAIIAFQAEKKRPTLIIITSVIAYGAPNLHGTAEAHGAPLGEDEVKLTKQRDGWPENETFLVPDAVLDHFQKGIGARGGKAYRAWVEKCLAYKGEFADLADQIVRMQCDQLPDGWDSELPTFAPDEKGIASRASSGKVLNGLAKGLPWLIGGAADLAPSTKTLLTFDEAGTFTATTPGGRNFHFGVREHAMAAIANGMALSKVRPYNSGFFIFSDYARPSIRLAALMELPVIYIFTHDSIGVGEDGPTHQPVEQLASLRAIPGLITIRPADANEVVEAWKVVAQLNDKPAAMILSRQNLPTLDRTEFASASSLAKGAYILTDADQDEPDVILIGTGSEVQLCVAAYRELKLQGIHARVVSMPSWELFEAQDEAYQQLVLPDSVSARVAVEQAAVFGWERYVGQTGVTIGMTTFGASAPMKDLQKKFGFTVEAVVDAAMKLASPSDAAAV